MSSVQVDKSSFSKLYYLHIKALFLTLQVVFVLFFAYLVCFLFFVFFWEFVQVMVGWWLCVKPVRCLNLLVSVSFLMKCLIRLSAGSQPTGMHHTCTLQSTHVSFLLNPHLFFRWETGSLKKLRDSVMVTEIEQIKVFWWSLWYLTCLEK